jgi:aryl-alcohol dehydrogenase-like predicted oxidoreductase
MPACCTSTSSPCAERHACRLLPPASRPCPHPHRRRRRCREEFIGEFIKETATSPVIATKFPPLPWALTADSLVAACEASLKRLQQPKIGLYIQHWPGFFFNAFSNDAYLEGLAQCYEKGLCEAVGVSNFNVDRIRGASRALEARGTCLSSNQVQYSLL